MQNTHVIVLHALTAASGAWSPETFARPRHLRRRGAMETLQGSEVNHGFNTQL